MGSATFSYTDCCACKPDEFDSRVTTPADRTKNVELEPTAVGATIVFVVVLVLLIITTVVSAVVVRAVVANKTKKNKEKENKNDKIDHQKSHYGYTFSIPVVDKAKNLESFDMAEFDATAMAPSPHLSN